MPRRPAPRSDAFGDPLPPGLRVRIGSKRLLWEGRNLVASHDGSLLASGTSEGWVNVWDARTGLRAHRLRSKSVNGRRTNWSVEHLRFSPDARQLASSCGGLVTCWDLASGKPLWEVRANFDFSVPFAFAPDGKTLAAGNSGVILLDATTGGTLAELLEIQHPAHGIYALAFTADGSRLVLGRSKTLTTLALGDARASRTLELPVVPTARAFVNEIALPDFCGTPAYVAHGIGGLYQVDLDEMAIVRHWGWPGQATPNGLEQVALGPASAVVIDRVLYRQDASGDWVRLDGPSTERCAISGDGETFAVARSNGGDFIEVYEPGSGVPRHAIPRVTGTIALGEHEGRSTLLAPGPARLDAFDPETGACVGSRPLPPGHVLDLHSGANRLILREPGYRDSLRELNGDVLVAPSDKERPMSIAPDGQSWLSRQETGVNTELSLRRLDGTSAKLWNGSVLVYGHAFSPDSARVAVGFYSTPGLIWDARTFQRLGVIPQIFIWSMSWAPDASLLLCGLNSGTARVWDPAKNDWAFEVDCGRTLVRSVAWAPSGDRFATASQATRVWDRAGHFLQTVPGSGELLFTADGRGLAIRSDTIVEIWDVG